MLTRIRIEVEEHSPEQCVRSLDKYENAVAAEEATRWAFEGLPTPEGMYYGGEMGRELMEEVIEYDEGIPGYKARRVVRYSRLDTRDDTLTLPSSEANMRWLEPAEAGPRVSITLNPPRPGGNIT